MSSGMCKFGPEGVPATAGVFAAASVCIAAYSVFVCVFIEFPVIGAFDGFAIHIGIAVAAAAGIGHCLWRASAVGMLWHRRSFRSAATGSIGLYELRFRIVIQCVGRYKPWHSTFTSHKNTAILRADFSSTRPARKTGRTDKDVCLLLYD